MPTIIRHASRGGYPSAPYAGRPATDAATGKISRRAAGLGAIPAGPRTSFHPGPARPSTQRARQDQSERERRNDRCERLADDKVTHVGAGGSEARAIRLGRERKGV